MVTVRPIALSYKAAADYLSLSESGVKTRVRTDPGFPKPIDLGERRVGLLLAELDAWVASRPRANKLPPEGCGYGRAGKSA